MWSPLIGVLDSTEKAGATPLYFVPFLANAVGGPERTRKEYWSPVTTGSKYLSLPGLFASKKLAARGTPHESWIW
jgi:hypothetical protein